MSIEDDMYEYGFSDTNDYLDFIMDESERELEKIRRKEELVESLSEDQIDSLMEDEAQENEDRRKRRDEEYQKRETIKLEMKKLRINEELELKQWIGKNPEEAEIWSLYSGFDISPQAIEDLGKDNKEYYWKGYSDWRTWKKNRKDYFKFKLDSPQEWNEWKLSCNIPYLRDAIDLYFKRNKIDDNYRDCCKWASENNRLWNTIRKESNSLKTDDEYELYAWLKYFKWKDTFKVWKVKEKDTWNLEKKRWRTIPEKEKIWVIEKWQEENKQRWIDWKKEIVETLNKWEEFLKNLHSYFSGKQREDEIENSSERFFVGFYEEDLSSTPMFGDEEEQENERVAYFKRLKDIFEDDIKDCSVIYDKLIDNEVYILNEETRKCFIDRMAMCLWINNNKKEWQTWKNRQMWIYYYQTIEPRRIITHGNALSGIKKIDFYKFVYYTDKDYFEVWKASHSLTWEKWKKDNFMEWKHKAQELDKWRKWIFTGNEWLFDEFAKNNIINWENFKDDCMSIEMQSAYKNCFCFREFNSYKDLRNKEPDKWSYYRHIIKEWLLIEQFNKEKKNDIPF